MRPRLADMPWDGAGASRVRTSGASPAYDGWPQRIALSLGYIAVYLVLERLTFFQSLHGIDVTPWNPQPGLTLALMIAKGWGYLPVAVAAQLLTSQLVPLVSVPLWVAFPAALVVATGYGTGAALFRRYIGANPPLQHARELMVLIMIITAAAAAVTIGFVSIYTAAGLIPPSDFGKAGFQLWIGDAIGAIVVTPLVLVTAAHGRPTLAVLGENWIDVVETLGQWLSIAVALMLAFGVGQDRLSFERFYLLFLPLVWIAVRRGLGGASWAVVSIQVGLVIALLVENRSATALLDFQMLMFAVATTGLMLGGVVSERGSALRALGESEGRLATIVNTARDAVLMIDASGRIESANPAVERLFGYSARRLGGRDVRELIVAPQPLETVMSPDPNQPTPATPWQLQAQRADGTLFPIEVTAGPFGAGPQRHYTLVVRDVTSRRDAEMRLRLHESEVAAGSRFSLADEMATAIAHEINQPLMAIASYSRGCLRMLKDPRPDADMLREGVTQVVEQAARAGDIVQRLRELVRGGSIERAPVDVRVILDAAAALVETEASRGKVDIAFRVPPDPPPVLADRIQIEQVLVNLMRNAIEAAASAPQRKVVVTVRQPDADRIEFTVADSGRGLSADIVTRLFEPFVTTKPYGMGLGLPICRSILEAHGDRLQLVSNSGRGAVFAFALPIAHPER